MPETTVEEVIGCVLAKHRAGTREHRWWFDVTDADRLVFVEEVVEDGSGRHFMEKRQSSVPEQILDALEREGYDEVYDTDANPLT